MSSGPSPYFSVNSLYERCAIASLRSRVKACACTGSSSMQPTITAAPNSWAMGTTRSNFSSPSSRLLALTYCQGKSIINSINLEDGEEKFERVVPIAHEFGAAVIVGCIDEDPVQAQAFTRERKLAIAQRSYKLLTEKYGLGPEDIVFDPLVFPCATGDENYIGGAVETVEGIRLIKQALPDVRTILGISNVSFGLPAGARGVVYLVFLYYVPDAGVGTPQ